MATEVDAQTTVRADLHDVLHEQRKVLERLLDLVADDNTNPARLVDLVDILEGLDERRDLLIQRLREEASWERLREEERSVRQIVLRALQQIGRPQKAGFLNEYVWARERVNLNTRGFGGLRRDERNAWERHRDHRLAGDPRSRRVAYIVPALDAEGRAHPRWLTRSDWPALKRVVLSRDDRFVELTKLRALIRAWQERNSGDIYDPLIPLIEKHAGQLLEDNDAPPISEADKRVLWLEHVSKRTEKEFKQAERETQKERQAAAELIDAMPEEAQLWGRPR